MEFGDLVGLCHNYVNTSQDVAWQVMTPTDLQTRRLNNHDEEDQASGILISVLFPFPCKI